MLRSSLFSGGAIALLSMAASAQMTAEATKVTGATKARTFNAKTGTWSRTPLAAATFNSSVLFNNSAPTGYFFGTSSVFNTIDHGRLPSPNSPTNATSVTGNSVSYTIDCFQIGYCSNIPLASGGVDFTIAFYDDYAPCADIDAIGQGGILSAAFFGTGLPGGTPASAQGCWTVSFDLSNTSLTWCMRGDGDGTWNNQANIDSFGWALTFDNAVGGAGGNGTGPFISGNCPSPISGATTPKQGAGTKWDGVPGASDATGLGTNDFFWIDSNFVIVNANGGCFFFGGCNFATGPAANPYGSFWLQMFGEKDGDPCPIGTQYCSSRINASGGPALITATALDSNADLQFQSSPVPNATGQFFYGPMMLGGMGNLGDGLRCVGGMTTRMLPFVTAGMMMQPPNGVIFNVNYTAPYATGLTGRKYFQHWFRSTLTTGTGSNTSDGIQIDF